jgi:ABC-2 type transport system permease protein
MKSCLRVTIREFCAIFDSRRLIAIAIIAPITYALYFGAIYWHKKVMRLPVTIVDQDNSVLSREITRSILASETFRLAQYSASADEFPAQSALGKSNACFIFPYHFERDVKSGRGSKVAVWVDTSNILVGNVVITTASTIIGAYSAGVDIRRSLFRGRASASSALSIVQPVRDESRIWFNPSLNYNYANFMLVGFVTVSIQLLTVLLVAQCGSREYEDDTLAGLRAITRSPMAVVIGKGLPYVIVMLPISLLALIIPTLMVGVPIIGSLWLLTGMTTWFLSIWVLVGIGISALVGDSLMAIEVFALIVMPSYLLSGNTWPTFAMPLGMRIVSYSLPLNHYVILVRKITMMGAEIGDLGQQITGLAVWSIIATILAYLGARKLTGDTIYSVESR